MNIYRLEDRLDFAENQHRVNAVSWEIAIIAGGVAIVIGSTAAAVWLWWL